MENLLFGIILWFSLMMAGGLVVAVVFFMFVSHNEREAFMWILLNIGLFPLSLLFWVSWYRWHGYDLLDPSWKRPTIPVTFNNIARLFNRDLKLNTIPPSPPRGHRERAAPPPPPNNGFPPGTRSIKRTIRGTGPRSAPPPPSNDGKPPTLDAATENTRNYLKEKNSNG